MNNPQMKMFLLIMFVVTLFMLDISLGEGTIGKTAYINNDTYLFPTPAATNHLEILPTGTKVTITSTVQTANEHWYGVNILDTGHTGFVIDFRLDIIGDLTKTNQISGSNPYVEVDKEYVMNKLKYIEQLYGSNNYKVPVSNESVSMYHTLQVGDKGPDVQKLKDRMFELGYFKNQTKNDTFTSNTAEYVKKFQKANGLIQDGIASPEMQALFYSNAAIGANSESHVSKDPIEIVSAEIHDFHGNANTTGTSLYFSVKNNLKETVDSYQILVIPCRASGELIIDSSSVSEYLSNGVTVFENERYSIGPGKTYSDKEKRVQHLLSEDKMIVGCYLMPYYYHTQNESDIIETSNMYGVGRGVNKGNTKCNDTLINVSYPPTNSSDTSFMLGVTTFKLPGIIADYFEAPYGLGVYSVENNSLAEKSGVREGDLLISLGNVYLAKTRDLDYAKALMSLEGKAELIFWREGHYYSVLLYK